MTREPRFSRCRHCDAEYEPPGRKGVVTCPFCQRKRDLKRFQQRKVYVVLEETA